MISKGRKLWSAPLTKGEASHARAEAEDWLEWNGASQSSGVAFIQIGIFGFRECLCAFLMICAPLQQKRHKMFTWKLLSRSVFLATALHLFTAVVPALAEGMRPITTASIPARRNVFSASQALAEVNAYRAAQGLTPVRLDPAAMKAASAQSLAMGQAGSMSHSVAGSLGSRLSQAGLGNVRAVENIAMGQRTWREVFEAWKASGSHDANLRASGMTRLGVAQAVGTNGPYWTLILAGDPGKFW
jgi:uncharacterized protein YkwD